MKTTEEVLKALRECTNQSCTSCPYFGTTDMGELITCTDNMRNDAVRAINRLSIENKSLHETIDMYGGEEGIKAVYEERDRLADENRAMKAELKVNLGNQYWMNICKMNARQEAKGLDKYGEPLEENTTLTTVQRIEHLQEELIDALKYCEHLKAVSNDGITANDYQRAAMRTAGDDTENYLLNGVMGLCGESGEVIDLVKKHLYQGHELDKTKVAEETSDCLWYCALIATAIDMNLGDIMQLNIDKLKRRYPAGFDKARSVNRKE